MKNLNKTGLMLIGLVLLLISYTSLQAQNIYVFSNAGASGRLGPNQNQINNTYGSTNLAGQVISSQGIQEWIVPASGSYSITVSGAQGGDTWASGGGGGRSISTEINLTTGQVLNIVVGQKGQSIGSGVYKGGSGGGGSFVYTGSIGGSGLIIAAGGGGGGRSSNYNVVSNNPNANYSENGNFIRDSGGYISLGGQNGHGGGFSNRNILSGGPGTGWFSNYNISYAQNSPSLGGTRFYGGINTSAGRPGGFGGGGASGDNNGNSYYSWSGGGGGYSGGAAGHNGGRGDGQVGGGGGSYVTGINRVDLGLNRGDGKVIISLLGCIEPVAICKNATISLDSNGNATLLTADVNNGSTAECGLQSMTLSKTGFTCDDVGNNLVTLTVTDINGVVSTCQATVTLEDNMNPVATAQDVIVELDASGNGSTTAILVNNGSSDACGIASLELSQYNFDCSDLGTQSNNSALDFDGVNDYVVVPNNSATSLNSFTVEAWIKSTATSNSRIVTKPVGGGQNYSLMLWNGYPHIRFDINGVGAQSTQGSSLVNDNQWHHLAGVHDTSNNTLTLYVDGVFTSSTNLIGDPTTGSESLFIGKFSSNYNDYFNGLIDEVRVWNIPRSASEISTYYNMPLVGNESGLVVNYNFDEGSGLVLNDQTNSANGSLQNMNENDDWVNGASAFDSIGVPVVLTAIDNNGNEASGTAYVVVKDITPPELVCEPITVDADPGLCEANIIITPPIVSDNCSGTGNALDFDGINDSVNMTTSGLANTIEFWMHSDSPINGNSETMILASFNNSNANYIIANNFTSSISGETISLNIGFSGNIYTKAPLNSGWNHIAITSNGSVYSNIYLNGIEVASSISGNPGVLNLSSMILGIAPSQSAFYKGKLDEFRVWNYTRTPEQIQTNLNTELSAQAGLLGLYHFNEGIANSNNTGVTTAFDSSGNNKNGTLQNFGLNGLSSNWVGERNSIELINSFNNSSNASGIYPLGETEINWTATDANGNSSSCTQTITVEDNEAPSLVQFPAPALAIDNIPEAKNYNLVYKLDIPNTSNWDDNNQVTYSKNNAGSLASEPFTRVAYLLELDDKWVWVSYDQITQDYNEIGVPVDYAKQLKVDNMNVYASANSGLTTGENIQTGNIEFWSNGYGRAAGNGTISSGNNGLYDFNDTPTSLDGYGSFQIHNYGASETLFAYNRWSAVSSQSYHKSDLGIGNNSSVNSEQNAPVINPDWTYAYNADTYNIKNIYVLTLNASATINDVTLVLDENGQATLTESDIENVFSNNCGEVSLSFDQTTFDCSDVGVNIISVTVSDSSGNQSIFTVNVTIEDNITPVVIGNDVEVTLTASGMISIVANDVLNSGSDSCGIVTYEISQDTFGAQDALNSPVTIQLTGTDANGNETIVPIIVTVIDPVPNAICKSITVQLDENGTVTITPKQIDDGSNSVVDIGSLSLDIVKFDCSNIGDNPVVLTVQSTLGAVATCEAVVTVEDKVVPVVATQNITVQLDSAGNASITPDMIDNGSTDNCEIASYDLDIASFDCDDITGLLNTDNTVVVTLTVTDIHGNVSSAPDTVTVEDNVNPIITCAPNDTRYIDPYQTFYTVDGTEFDATASDNCEIDTITYSGGSPSSSGSSMAGIQLDLEFNTMNWIATDVNGNKSYCTTVVEVLKRPTSLTYNGDVVEQYSDSIDLSATLIDDVSGDGIQGKTVTFTIGLQSTTAVTNTSGVASTTLILTQDPASVYKVKSEIIEDVGYLGSVDEDNFDITQEDAIVVYTGQSLQATPSSRDSEAIVVLSANIQDITVNLANTLHDPYAGDIRKAKVMFVNRDNGSAISGWIPVTDLIDPSDNRTGTVSYNWLVDINNQTSESFTVGIVVDTGYYIRDSSEDDTVVTVYVPTGDFITGGGYILPNASSGQYASTNGLKTNFGFNVKYNKKGNKLKGHMNVIFRRLESDGITHVYQIKSNAVQSLGVDVSDETAQFATFITKSNLKDITDPLYPVSLGGNLILKVDMTDRGEPGSEDSIAFNLTQGGTLLYSSNWTGIITDEMQLSGGNLVVHSGFSLGSPSPTAKTSESVVLDVNYTSNSLFELKTWPNPSDTYFNINLKTDNHTENSKIQVFDVRGKLVQSNEFDHNLVFRFGKNFEAGVYFVKIEQGSKMEFVRVVKF